eukprot:1182969-Prorocentrum_minimum.AAC.2
MSITARGGGSVCLVEDGVIGGGRAESHRVSRSRANFSLSSRADVSLSVPFGLLLVPQSDIAEARVRGGPPAGDMAAAARAGAGEDIPRGPTPDPATLEQEFKEFERQYKALERKLRVRQLAQEAGGNPVLLHLMQVGNQPIVLRTTTTTTTTTTTAERTVTLASVETTIEDANVFFRSSPPARGSPHSGQ